MLDACGHRNFAYLAPAMLAGLQRANIYLIGVTVPTVDEQGFGASKTKTGDIVTIQKRR
jgi:hypothetical protein